jgi:predicted MPP superfamily phosphohydrolase
MGVFSVLGNHDYGDYVRWNSDQEKVQNLNNLKGVHREMGWRLLLNEHQILEKDGHQIALIGIENWGAKGNFSRYGDLGKAYAGTESHPFKILMSHDPSHWEAEVCKHYGDIDLMLSGHTHGMQFGVEIPGFRWSPVQYMYRQWAGVYSKTEQKLYVNRGFGFLGYPGRVGILPEITLIELTS